MQLANAPMQEHIPDKDVASRLIDAPRMHTEEAGLIWSATFEFPGGQHESVIWRKYAKAESDVDALGYAREKAKQQTNPNMTYAGFISAVVGKVRSIRTARGHGFTIEHLPDEGIYHAGIGYAPTTDSAFTKADKAELKLALQKAFAVGSLFAKS